MLKDEHRIAQHPSSDQSCEKIYLAVHDDIYKDRFDYEEIGAEMVKDKFHKCYRVVEIPFLTYGINKGDIVKISKDRVVTELLTDDGQYGYRIAFPAYRSEEEAHEKIEQVLVLLNRQGFETEFFNHKISAVNAINSSEAVRLEGILVGLTKDAKIEGCDTIR